MTERRLASEAFVVPEGEFGERVRRVLGVIDTVHRVAPLPRIPIVERIMPLGIEGAYQYDRRRGRPRSIDINREAPHPDLTLVHEIGHLPDHQILGNPAGFASFRHPELENWRQCVIASRAWSALRTARWAIIAGGGPVGQLDYLLDESELWARSYAQFIVSRSRDHALTADMEHVRQQEQPIRWAQWEPEDVAPIMQAIEALIHNKGWQP
jgi:hypothetical protein